MKLALAGVLVAGAALGLALPHSGSGALAVAQDVQPFASAQATMPRPAAAPASTAPSSGGHFLTTASVNGQPVEMVVDTGASIVALSEADARRIGIAYNPADFQVIGSGASGAVRGTEVTIDLLAVDGKEVRSLRAAVVEGLDVSLLGQSYLSRIGGVVMTGDEMVLR